MICCGTKLNGGAKPRGIIMGEFMTRFFGHSGRISRRTMWIGLLALVVVAILLEIVFSLIFGFGGMMRSGPAFMTSISQNGETIQSMYSAKGEWRQLFMLALLAYPLSTLWFKRSHDINRSGLLVVIYLGVAMLSYFVDIIGWGFVTPEVGQMHMLTRTWLGTIMQVFYVLLALYLVVTLGFFAGTKGSNLYGADPHGQ